jgi:hypothetical protein
LRTLDCSARGMCAAQYARYAAQSARAQALQSLAIIDNPLPPI